VARWIGLAVVWLLVAHGSAAADDSADYKQLVKQALHEFQLGNFNEAKAFFTQAHGISPNARTLRGLGMSSYELRGYVEAIDYFEAALASIERPLTNEMRAEVTRLLAQARAFITHVKLSLEPPNAEVRVDTHPARRDASGELLLDPGTHELSFEAHDYETTTRSIRADGNETLAFSVSLRPLRPAPAPAQETPFEAPVLPQPSAAPASAPSAAISAASSPGPWIVIGVSGAVAVAGGVLLALALSDKSSVEHPKGNGVDGPYYSDYYGANQRVLPLSAAGITALCAGGVGMALGVIWKVSEGASVETQGAGLRLRGRF
jgi:hypothetical protein